MTFPRGYYVIYTPKYRIPGIFDLHERRMFNGRPFVTHDDGFQIIADKDFDCKLVYEALIEKNTEDPDTGQKYNWVTEQKTIDLDTDLALKPNKLSRCISDPAVAKEIMNAFVEWRNGFVPLNDNGKVDKTELKKKLSSSIRERKGVLRKNLVRRNSGWILAAIPRMIQDFYLGIYQLAKPDLYTHYVQKGGQDSENTMIWKMMLLQRIYMHDGDDILKKPNGNNWQDEDEIWECWVGFAGSEEEAVRIQQTLEEIFRPICTEPQQKATA